MAQVRIKPLVINIKKMFLLLTVEKTISKKTGIGNFKRFVNCCRTNCYFLTRCPKTLISTAATWLSHSIIPDATSFSNYSTFYTIMSHHFCPCRRLWSRHHVGFDRCDQMARLFFIIWPFATIKICPMAYKICQSRFRILVHSKSPLKIFLWT